MDLMTGRSAISQTLNITKELRNIDGKIDIAEFKLRLADLVERWLEAKESLQDAKQREADLRSQIEDLKTRLHQKAHLEDQDGFLYELDGDRKRIGEPYCNLCHVREDRLYRMRHIAPSVGRKEGYICDNCKTVITTGPALPSPPVGVNRRGSEW